MFLNAEEDPQQLQEHNLIKCRCPPTRHPLFLDIGSEGSVCLSGRESNDLRKAMQFMLGEKKGIEIGEQRGEKRGIEIGEKRGAIKTLIRMVNKGKYTIEEAAEEAGITVPEFKAEMQLQAQPG